MSLLPLSPFLAAALVCTAATMSVDRARPPASPVLRHVSADRGWQDELLFGPGPVFQPFSGPLRG